MFGSGGSSYNPPPDDDWQENYYVKGKPHKPSGATQFRKTYTEPADSEPFLDFVETKDTLKEVGINTCRYGKGRRKSSRYTGGNILQGQLTTIFN